MFGKSPGLSRVLPRPAARAATRGPAGPRARARGPAARGPRPAARGPRLGARGRAAGRVAPGRERGAGGAWHEIAGNQRRHEHPGRAVAVPMQRRAIGKKKKKVINFLTLIAATHTA